MVCNASNLNKKKQLLYNNRVKLLNFHRKYVYRRRGRGQEFYSPLPNMGLFLSMGAGEREKWKHAGKGAIFLEDSVGTSSEERWNFKILPTYSEFDKQLLNLKRILFG